ncbi:MAG: tyrosine-type recombinase/integrase, partial [Fusobacteriaceae bacterium]
QYKPMHDYLVEKIESYRYYVEKMYQLSKDELEEMFLFPSSFEKNSKLSYRGLYSLIQEMGKIIGKDISPHNVRHAIATELSLNGADILEIRDFLGHADTRVTEIYINAKSILEKRVLDKIPVPKLD